MTGAQRVTVWHSLPLRVHDCASAVRAQRTPPERCGAGAGRGAAAAAAGGRGGGDDESTYRPYRYDPNPKVTFGGSLQRAGALQGGGRTSARALALERSGRGRPVPHGGATDNSPRARARARYVFAP